MSNLPPLGQQLGTRATQTGTATIRFGVYNQPGPWVGRTIAQLREELGVQWNMPDDIAAYKGKEVMDASYVVQPGDNIEFHRKMGEKGLSQ